MAVDALEYDESAEDANPSSALSEILESPERLKDLDLDAFAEELERQVIKMCDVCAVFEECYSYPRAFVEKSDYFSADVAAF